MTIKSDGKLFQIHVAAAAEVLSPKQLDVRRTEAVARHSNFSACLTEVLELHIRLPFHSAKSLELKTMLLLTKKSTL